MAFRELLRMFQNKREERAYYGIIREKIKKILEGNFYSVDLEDTSKGRFSNRLRTELTTNYDGRRDIIYFFIKDTSPDIVTGGVKVLTFGGLKMLT